jgi:molybdopterin molybdotransferase
VPDRLPETIACIERAREWDADVLITAGGASVGDYDLVQQALTKHGMTLDFWRIAMRPGRPLMHGRLGSMRVLGVPGNPVSAFVCAFLFAGPLIRRLCGRTDLMPTVESARLGAPLPANDERADYLRAGLSTENGALVATPFKAQDSSMLANLANADCLVIREPFAPPAAEGSSCSIVKLGF